MAENDKPTAKTGAGDKPTAAQLQTQAKAAETVDEITYHPGEGDPARTKWNGLEFKAYVPVKVSAKHTVAVPIREEIKQPDGSIITRAVERRIPMLELARQNHKFSVNGEAPFMHKMGAARVPTTPDEYRGYAISWIAASTAASAMDARWEAEETLREKCGVEDTDIAYLRPFFEARREQVTPAAA